MAELYNRPVEIRIPGKPTLRICEIENDGSVVPLRLSYHNNNHYNSVRDPKDTTIGIGLGLPANQVPTTEKMLVADAVEQSLKTDADQQILDTVALESVQDHINEELLAATAITESEWDTYADDAEDALYAAQIEDEDLEAAIRLSLQEASGGNS